MTYSEFVTSVKSMVFPDREASNLVANHTRFVLDGLIELQKRVPQLRSRNFNLYPFDQTNYRCGATVVEKPNGPIIRLFTYTQADHCDSNFYLPTTRENMEALMEQWQCAPDTLIPAGVLQGAPPNDIYHAEALSDKGYRASFGYFAVFGNQIYVWPHLESTEQLGIEWSGIKTSYLNTDVVQFEVDVQAAVELYVQYQQALREDCDLQKYSSIGTEWTNRAAHLTWWYRKKELLPEQPWREVQCCVCAAAETEGGGLPPPTGTTFTIYLGNIGEAEPASYTEAQILAMENTFGISKVKSVLAAGDYEIGRPASNINEFRVVAFPKSVRTGAVQFINSGFPLPMNELPEVTIAGAVHRVFRTTIQSIGDLSVALGRAISIVTP